MRESHFQSLVRKRFVGAGALVFNVHGHAMQEPGWPDLQVYSPLWCGHLELKTMNGKLSVLQERRLAQLKRVRFPAFVLREDGLVDGSLQLDMAHDGRMWLDELRRYSDSMYLLTSTWLRNVGLPTLSQSPSFTPKPP